VFASQCVRCGVVDAHVTDTVVATASGDKPRFGGWSATWEYAGTAIANAAAHSATRVI
jgi:hypothetical protein